MSFKPEKVVKKEYKTCYVGINDNSLFIPKEDINSVEELFFQELPMEVSSNELIFIGTWKDFSLFSFNKENSIQSETFQITHRDLISRFHNEKGFIQMLGRVISLNQWHTNNKFCGRCGGETSLMNNEPGFKCLNCSAVFYPRISPAVIVLIHNHGKILLARNRHFSRPVFSCIAGYVDPGENFEQTVPREVLEEVGLEIQNIKYFKSQFWPVSNSLISGYFAEYKSGVIKPDGDEIVEADWFSPEDLPLLPSKGSISRELIDYYMDNILRK